MILVRQDLFQYDQQQQDYVKTDVLFVCKLDEYQYENLQSVIHEKERIISIEKDDLMRITKSVTLDLNDTVMIERTFVYQIDLK